MATLGVGNIVTRSYGVDLFSVNNAVISGNIVVASYGVNLFSVNSAAISGNIVPLSTTTQNLFTSNSSITGNMVANIPAYVSTPSVFSINLQYSTNDSSASNPLSVPYTLDTRVFTSNVIGLLANATATVPYGLDANIFISNVTGVASVATINTFSRPDFIFGRGLY